MPYYQQLLIVCPLIFLGAMIDAIAGGGGLITLPAYYLAGLPPHMAMGTNKLSSSIATTVSASRFVVRRSLHWPTALVSCALALAGSALGAHLTSYVSEQALQIFLLVALPVLAVFLLTRKNDFERVREPMPPRRTLAVSAVVGLVIGAYDGFFGPGTGTFLILAFTYLLGLELRKAMGNAKLVNLSSNVAALFTFGLQGNVMYRLALPAAACAVVGGYIGAGLALRRGAGVFKPVLIVVLALLLARIASDLFSLL